MKKVLCYAMAVLGLTFAAATTAKAQVPYEQGPVDFKKNTVPMWEAEKAAGVIVGYQIFVNSTTSGPDDWDIGYSITYKNMAALDGLPDRVYEFRMKQYGDHAAEQKVIEKRVENAHIVSSMLIRDIKLR